MNTHRIQPSGQNFQCFEFQTTYCAGLFRHVASPAEQAGRKGGKGKRKRAPVADPLEPLAVGSLSVLRAASKGGVDPDGKPVDVEFSP